MGFDFEELKKRVERMKARNSLDWIVSGIEILNAERVLGQKEKQVAWFSKHLSHDDYILQGFMFVDLGFNPVCFAAGKNVDVPLLRNIFPFHKYGAVFIDRQEIDEMASSRNRVSGRARKILGRKIKSHKARAAKAVKEVLESGYSFLDYVEGGRDYRWREKCVVKRGYLNYMLDALRSMELRKRKILTANIAVDYLPERPEEDFFPALNWFRDRAPAVYPYARTALDLYALAFFQFFKISKPYFFINFGEIRVLNEFAESGRLGYAEFAEHVKQDIEKLGRELRQSDAYQSRLREVGRRAIS